MKRVDRFKEHVELIQRNKLLLHMRVRDSTSRHKSQVHRWIDGTPIEELARIRAMGNGYIRTALGMTVIEATDYLLGNKTFEG